MTTIIIALLFFSIIIVIHEAGHFLVAKAVGIYAEEFSIGMGPRLFKIQGKETDFSLRIIPMGGYVKFLGEDENSSDPRAFSNAKVWKRMAVIASGPVMNLLLAVLLLFTLYSAYGVFNEYTPYIGELIEDYPAEKAGIKVNDKIIGINNIDLSQMNNKEAVEKIRRIISESKGEPLEIKVERNGAVKDFNIKPVYDEADNRYQIGFYFDYNLRKLNILESLKLSFLQTFQIIYLMVTSVIQLIFGGGGINDLMGPVGIVGEIGKAAQAGFQQLLNLGILITINLGIINLIPFPALDGGRLVILLIEGFRGKPIDPKKEGVFHLIGFVLLILLLIIVTYKDVIRI